MLESLDAKLDILLEDEGSKHTACVAVFRKHNGHIELLVGLRKADPCIGQWAMPGGHGDEGETPEQTARRELQEETGIAATDLTFVSSRPGEPGRAQEDYVFATEVKPDVAIFPKDDSGGIRWIPIDAMPPLAFKDDELAIAAATKLFGDIKVLESISRSEVLTEESKKKLKKTLSSILKNKSPARPGILICLDGVDGVGKSVQTAKLCKWLEKEGYTVTTSKWNSSDLMQDTIRTAKKARLLSPMLYSLMHACDMIYRYEYEIVPALLRNEIVVCDRYFYTSLARDRVRGIDTNVLRNIYKNLREPDLLIHCVVPIETAFERVFKHKGLQYYSSGMDMNLASSREESCIKYTQLVDKAYNSLMPKQAKYYWKCSMDQSIDDVFKQIKKKVSQKFGVGKY